MIVPMVSKSERYHANYLGQVYDVATGEELDKLS